MGAPDSPVRGELASSIEPPMAAGSGQSAQLDYLLQTGVPGAVDSLHAALVGYRAISLVQGMMPDAAGAGVPLLGVILNRADVKILTNAEILREGIFVRRQPSVTRRAGGTYARWTTRRIGVGRGEGASQLGIRLGDRAQAAAEPIATARIASEYTERGGGHESARSCG